MPVNAPLSPWVVLTSLSRKKNLSADDHHKCTEVFLNADPATRRLWIETNVLSEDVAVAIMENANRVELNRVGKILLSWRKPPGEEDGPHVRRSEKLLRAAATRASAGGGNKLFVTELCGELVYTTLGAQLCIEAPDVVDRIVSRALGGKPFVERIHTVGTEIYINAVATLYKNLHGFDGEEVDRLATVCPLSKALNGADWSGIIGRVGRDRNAGQLLTTLSQHVGRVNHSNIDVVISDNLDLFVYKADQYVPPEYQRLRTVAGGVAMPPWHADGAVLDSPLALFRAGYTPARLGWVFALWSHTYTGPSVNAGAGAMFAQPNLLPLVLTGPTDGSGDAQLVAAAECAAERLPEQSLQAGLTDESPYWMRDVATRILSTIPIRSEALKNWLVGSSCELTSHLLCGRFPANSK